MNKTKIEKISSYFRYVLLLIYFPSLLVVAGFAGDNSWSLLGLDSIQVYSIAINPSNPNIVYAGTFNYGVYKSYDAGSTWTQCSTGMYTGCIYSLAIDPVNPNIIYAGTYAFSHDYCNAPHLSRQILGFET